MKRFLPFLGALLTALSLYAQPQPAAIDSLLQAYVREQLFSGVVLIAKDDQILYHRAFGLADRAKGVLNNTNTAFGLSSTGKILTGLLVRQLVAEGKIDPDATIDRYLPEYNLPKANEIRVRHLLTHTAGLTNYMQHPEYGPLQQKKGGPLLLDERVQLIAKMPLEFMPGERFRYSNSGFILLGRIVEKLTGMSYADALRQHILQPAGMTATAQPVTDVAIPYRALTDSLMVTYDIGDPLGSGSDGGAFSTTMDLFRLSQALRQGTLPHLQDWTKMLETRQPMGGGNGREDYANGFIVTKIGDRELYGHDGGSPGYTSDFRMDLKDGYTFIVLGNNTNCGSIFVVENLARLTFGEPVEQPRAPREKLIAELFERHSDAELLPTLSQTLVAAGYEPVDNPFSITRAADMLMTLGRVDLGIRIHTFNQQLFPDSPVPINALAEMYFYGLHDTDKALELFRSSAERFPEDDYAKGRLAEIDNMMQTVKN